MKPDEVFAERAFHGFLTRLGASPLAWALGDEPPDRYLSIDQERFAVEITHVMEIVDLGGVSLPDRGVNEALCRFAADVEATAKERGVLSGHYALFLEPIPNMAERREQLLEQIVGYLRETATLGSGEPVFVQAFENGSVIHAQKVSPLGQSIAEITGPADAKWPGQILGELSQLIRSAIVTKATKVAKVDLPKILLLIDAYHYGTRDEWQAYVNWVPEHPFHTIARVYGDYECQVLFSLATSWHAAAA